MPLGLLEGSLLGRFAGATKFAGTAAFAGAAAFAAAFTGAVPAPLPLCHCCLVVQHSLFLVADCCCRHRLRATQYENAVRRDVNARLC